MKHIVKMEKINKSFSGVKVLNDVNFNLKLGEIHALVGENGAGKSTLIKILSGAFQKDSGDIFINDKHVEISTPIDAKEKGIQCIYQELSLVPNLSIANNIFLGQEQTRNGFVKQKQINKISQDMVDELNINIDVRTEVKDVGIGIQFFTEICRCLVGNAKIVIMDEPTSAMTPSEYEHFLKTVKILRNKGISIIYISHRLDEIFEICDSVTVIRDGEIVTTKDIENITLKEMVRYMIGKEVSGFLKRTDKDNTIYKNVLMKLENVSTHKLKDISFELHEGEILGVTGLLGAGKSEIARAIFGTDKILSGKIYVDNEETNFYHPKDSMFSDIALVPEDRKGQGLFQDFSVKRNISIINLGQIERGKLFVDNRKENEFSKEMVNRFGIKCRSINQLVRNLSGGNQQKVVLAKWIARNPKVLILDEPTRGIDVGSKEEIYNLINQLAKQGMGVLLLSSEMDEVIAYSNRIIIMHDGEQKGELLGREATQKNILLIAAG